MPGLKGRELCAPLSNIQHQTFKNLMENEFKECSKITESYIVKARENKNWMIDDITEH